MNESHLHIISFNIPYPADYGGVIDVFYKIKSLYENQVKIILHVFEYGRKYASELDKYCEKVYYYKRKTGILSHFSTFPYIVFSRRDKELRLNLLKDNYPILFEGLHTCYYLNHSELNHRLKLVRIHNIEYCYYKGLSKNSKSLFYKWYFAFEAFKLKKYEKQLQHANYLLSLSFTEKMYLENKFGKNKTIYIPLFFQNNIISVLSKEIKPYVLYHGDLSTPENINAASFLIRSVASKDKNIQWVFAGLNPSKSLLKLIKQYENVSIKSNLEEEELFRLIGEASVNLLYTNQVSGVKIKLLNALFNGHYCIANKAMVDGSGLETLCEIVSDQPEEILTAIKKYILKKFPEDEIVKRKNALNQLYNNHKNALKINELLYYLP